MLLSTLCVLLFAEPSRILWTVDLTAPESGNVHMRAKIPAAALAGIERLEARFASRPGSSPRVRSFTAQAGGSPLDAAAPGMDMRSVKLPARPAAVQVDYEIDPVYPPLQPGSTPADARSRLTPELAVLRTGNIFAQFNVSAPARVEFLLPRGWTVLTPWTGRGGGFDLRPEELAEVEYLGAGPLDVREVDGGAAPVRLGVARGAAGLTADTAAAIIAQEVRLLGKLPPLAHTLIVVPPAFMRGGASGAHSAVQLPGADTLAHEVFHWWNTAALSSREAAWFQEGLTTYYGLKLAHAAGAFTEERRDACLADLQAEMRLLEAEGTVSLAQASRERADRRKERLVYSKGALFTLLLEREFAAAGHKLDDAVRAVLTSGRLGLTNTDLRRSLGQDVLFAAYVDGAKPLPDLNLPAPATGSSGCAFFFPP